MENTPAKKNLTVAPLVIAAALNTQPAHADQVAAEYKRVKAEANAALNRQNHITNLNGAPSKRYGLDSMKALKGTVELCTTGWEKPNPTDSINTEGTVGYKRAGPNFIIELEETTPTPGPLADVGACITDGLQEDFYEIATAADCRVLGIIERSDIYKHTWWTLISCVEKDTNEIKPLTDETAANSTEQVAQSYPQDTPPAILNVCQFCEEKTEEELLCQ